MRCKISINLIINSNGTYNWSCYSIMNPQ
jgi:hypothetical protein